MVDSGGFSSFTPENVIDVVDLNPEKTSIEELEEKILLHPQLLEDLQFKAIVYLSYGMSNWDRLVKRTSKTSV